MHFQGHRRDVLVLDGVGSECVLQRRVQDLCGRGVDQVEDRAQVDGKALLALAHEHLGGHRAAGDVDRVHVLRGVGLVGRRVAQRLVTDVVHRLLEGGGATRGLAQRSAAALAAVAAHHGHTVGFRDVEVGVRHSRHGARLSQGDGHHRTTDVQLHALACVGQRVVEAELEGDVFHRVAVVVDVDFVQRVGVELEVVGTTVGVLQRLVVGDQRDVIGAARLVAHEHVEVRAIHLGARGDEGRLSVAGSPGRRQRRTGGDGCRSEGGAGGKTGHRRHGGSLVRGLKRLRHGSAWFLYAAQAVSDACPDATDMKRGMR